MSLLAALILALLQGLTEFLPVSSSGHLVLAQAMLDVSGPNELLYDVMLHVATALAIVLYFREDLLGVLRGLFGGRGAGSSGRSSDAERLRNACCSPNGRSV